MHWGGYTPELVDAICARIMGGESIKRICSEPEMPSQAIFYRWLAEDKDGIVEKYRTAREIQAELMCEELLEIADDGRNDWMEREGFSVVNHEHVQRSKLRVDARKWFMSKMAPRKYGDRTVLTGANDTPLIPPSTATPDRVAAVFLALAEKLPRPIEADSKDDETE